MALKPTLSMGVKMIDSVVQSGITETDLPSCPRQPKIQTNNMKQYFSRHWDQAVNDTDVRGNSHGGRCDSRADIAMMREEEHPLGEEVEPRVWGD